MNIGTGLIRTVVPLVVSGIVWVCVSLGVTLTDAAQQSVAGVVSVVAGGVYYVVVRALGHKFPWVEALLGSPKKPDYIKGVSWDAEDAPVEEPDDDDDEEVDDPDEEVEADAGAEPEVPGDDLDDEPWEDEPRDDHGRFAKA